MVQIEIPTELDAAMIEQLRSGALVLFSLLSFWLMSSANTSHHAQFHYEFYPSLTFFVWVGILSFLYSGVLLVAQHVNFLDGDLGLSLQQKGPYVMLFLTYTAAVAASATSSDLHATFDVNDGPVCRSRISTSRAESGTHFCDDVVAAVVFMYFLAATYALTLVLKAGHGFGGALASGGGVTDGFAGSTGYDNLDEAAKADMRPPAPHQMNV